MRLRLLLSVQCVQTGLLLQQDLRILICFASCVVSSVDGPYMHGQEHVGQKHFLPKDRVLAFLQMLNPKFYVCTNCMRLVASSANALLSWVTQSTEVHRLTFAFGVQNPFLGKGLDRGSISC